MKTKCEISICGDCANYGDCVEKKPFLCPYSLTANELKARILEWYKKSISRVGWKRGEKIIKVR